MAYVCTFSTLFNYLFLHDGCYWLWRKTGFAIDWLNAIIKRKT